MRIQLLFLFIFFNTIYSQNEISVKKIETIKYDKNKKLVGIDNLDNAYYLNNNDELIKGNNLKFSDLSLGKISKVDLYNSMKIKVWYDDYNTIVILDNYLNEITRINFNNFYYSYDISHISSANENSIWLYDDISMKIKKFDFIKKSFFNGIETQLEENVIDLKSNYNFLWVLTDNFFIKLNYNGGVIFKIKNKSFKKINLFKNDIILSNNNKLEYFNNEQESFINIRSKKLFIKDFFVIDETLYIYDEDHLNKYITLTY